MDPAGSTAAKTTSVLIPIAAATSGDLPDICALTGESAAGRWIRRAQGMTKVSIPISEELLARYAKRTRTARAFMMAFFFAWAVAIVVAILAGSAAHSGSLSAIAAWLFLLGLPLFIGAVVVLAKRTSTIPLRWRVLVAEDGRQYLRLKIPARPLPMR
jgi:hypothetical protein